MEWLTVNWIWLVLGLGAAWFFFRGGCGMGGHGSHEAHGAPRSKEIGTARTGPTGEGPREPEDVAPSARSRRRGC